MSKYRAAYKCELCGQKLLSTKFIDVPKERVSGVIGKILVDGKVGNINSDIPNSFTTHENCNFGCGVAKFSGLIEVR